MNDTAGAYRAFIPAKGLDAADGRILAEMRMDDPSDVAGATQLVQDGRALTVDGNTGMVHLGMEQAA